MTAKFNIGDDRTIVLLCHIRRSWHEDDPKDHVCLYCDKRMEEDVTIAYTKPIGSDVRKGIHIRECHNKVTCLEGLIKSLPPDNHVCYLVIYKDSYIVDTYEYGMEMTNEQALEKFKEAIDNIEKEIKIQE